MLKEYRTIREVYGPLVLVDEVRGAGYEEIVEVILPGGSVKMGRVLELSGAKALIQLFESAEGLNLLQGSVRFLAKGIRLKVSPDIVGRMFDGLGSPIDGAPAVLPDAERDINGLPINPYSRDYPSEFIQTGISAIDGLNTVVRGQKLPIFSGSGLPHNRLAAQIARQSEVPGKEESFAVVFAAMGITFEEANFFMNDFRGTGAIERAVLFINLADDPAIERIATPRLALTAAEYMAFELGMHVLVIMTDMTSYCESLREISAARREVPGRRGYPGYMYTDLATIYERAGRIKGKAGSITQLPILTMPEDDKTHPIPDLTGYITEGQLVLDRDLHKKSVYPPIDVLPSLSRLRDKGIGEGRTREDHAGVASQLFAAYARGKEARELSIILGEAALGELDRIYYRLADAFEEKFIRQKPGESRTIEETLRIGWDVLSMLPRAELKRIKPGFIEKYLAPEKKENGSS